MRHCVVCGNLLSQYNTDDQCFRHIQKEIEEKRLWSDAHSITLKNRGDAKKPKKYMNKPAKPGHTSLQLFNVTDQFIARLIDEVCAFYNVEKEKIFGPFHKEPIVTARHTAVYLLRSIGGLSFLAIARMFYKWKKDGATAYNAYQSMVAALTQKEELRKNIQTLSENLCCYKRDLQARRRLQAQDLLNDMQSDLNILNEKLTLFPPHLERNRSIFIAFYGLDGDFKKQTKEAVGKTHGLSRARIHQIIAHAHHILSRMGFTMKQHELLDKLRLMKKLKKGAY